LPKKKVETMEAPPKYRRFYGKMECLSLWTKHIGLNQGAIGNPLGTLREHVENKGKMKKNPPPRPPPLPRI
jgi:hypothetical protein